MCSFPFWLFEGLYHWEHVMFQGTQANGGSLAPKPIDRPKHGGSGEDGGNPSKVHLREQGRAGRRRGGAA